MRAEPQAEGPCGGERSHEAGWLAQLDLRFDTRGGRTVLRRNAHRGPLRVQRPFYPEGEQGSCHVYLLHPPGGVVGSDRLELSVRAEKGAEVLVTTPGAGKFYRTRGPRAFFTQRLSVEAGAYVELLPQETIVFSGAEARMQTRVELAQGAGALGWDIVCLGRPAAAERFVSGSVRQRIELWREGRLVWLERAEHRAVSPAMSHAWGLDGCAAVGTFWCTSGGAGALDAVRTACADDAPGVAFTCVRGVLVGRGLSAGAPVLRAAFERAWRALREVLGRPLRARPRVWNT